MCTRDVSTLITNRDILKPRDSESNPRAYNVLSGAEAVIFQYIHVYSIAAYVQYIPRNMHTVLLYFALLWLCNRS